MNILIVNGYINPNKKENNKFKEFINIIENVYYKYLINNINNRLLKIILTRMD